MKNKTSEIQPLLTLIAFYFITVCLITFCRAATTAEPIARTKNNANQGQHKRVAQTAIETLMGF